MFLEIVRREGTEERKYLTSFLSLLIPYPYYDGSPSSLFYSPTKKVLSPHHISPYISLSPFLLPETLAGKSSSQGSTTHLNSFIFSGQTWNNCAALSGTLNRRGHS